MPRERKDFHKLTMTDYEIAGNVFSAWRDGRGKLIAVLDETLDEYKPYSLLVMESYGDRKWDDVLQNDYGLDLETIRPKKDNKYQKLDIEYSGIEFYDRLIDVYKNGGDVQPALNDLYDFRDAAVRRAATTRLVAADDIIAQSANTASRAERAIVNLSNRRRVLRTRLTKQKNAVGHEPTKQSASKILKTESQIEENDEKLARAEKRLENANKRADTARNDAAVARALLVHRRPALSTNPDNLISGDGESIKNAENKLSYDVKYDVAPVEERVEFQDDKAHVSTVEQNEMVETEEITETTETTEDATITLPIPEYYELQQKTEETKMPDTPDTEEVKPLLDQDPEILDEEIAFKPVEFDDIKPRVDNAADQHMSPAEVKEQERSDDPFMDSRALHDMEKEENNNIAEAHTEEPVLDTIQSVEQPTVSDIDKTGHVENTQYENHMQTDVRRPVGPSTPAPSAPTSASRPISPITGGNVKVQPVGGHSKPTFVYYLLLILLIGLSIFTLWLYQKKNGGTVPFLNPAGETETVTQPDVISNGIFVEPEPIIEPKPVEAAPVQVAEPEPVPEPVPEPDVPVVTQPEPDTPIKIESDTEDVLIAADPEVPVVESEESVLARKQAYGVSREDQTVYVPVVEEPVVVEPEPVVRVTNVAAPDVIFDDDVISVPTVAQDYVDEEEMNYTGQDENVVYVQPDYVQPEPEYYYPQPEYYDAPIPQDVVEDNNYEPEDRQYLSIHDGGQYSIGYTETTY